MTLTGQKFQFGAELHNLLKLFGWIIETASKAKNLPEPEPTDLVIIY